MSDKTTDQVFTQLCDYARTTSLLTSIDAVLGWDDRTQLPPRGGEYRAEQLTHLAGLIHQRQTDSRLGEWLEELQDSPLMNEPHGDSATIIRQLRRDYDRKTKLPQSLVEELAHTAVRGQQVWEESRKSNDYKSFEPLLSKTIDLKRQQAEALGYPESPYDALLDEFEPGERTSNVEAVLAAFRKDLVPLVAEIRESSVRPDREIIQRSYPVAKQEKFGTQVATDIGFDFSRGRLDVTSHPFCTELGPHDCRITTRYDEHHFPGAFFGILHEAGHGIYQQGLRADQFGLPTGEPISLGIHESQSRMWENLVGRSRAFWEHYYADAQRVFSEALRDVPLDDFWFAINDVQASLIRVEADEVTYNLHILIRFELEQALINDQLQVANLPDAWNEKYEQYLGIRPPNNADGVMQDIHWSAGLIGYFPTYSLGNLYASQFFQQANSDIGDLSEMFRQGEFSPLRHWLGKKIHHPGQCYQASELVEDVTGSPLNHIPLMKHLREKFAPLYQL